MNEEQRFAFDTWGFLTVEDAITAEQVAELKTTVDLTIGRALGKFRLASLVRSFL